MYTFGVEEKVPVGVGFVVAVVVVADHGMEEIEEVMYQQQRLVLVVVVVAADHPLAEIEDMPHVEESERC